MGLRFVNSSRQGTVPIFVSAKTGLYLLRGELPHLAQKSLQALRREKLHATPWPHTSWGVVWFVAGGGAWHGLASSARSIEIVLKDGRVLKGTEAKVAGLADLSGAADKVKGLNTGGDNALQLIVFLDDNLRRTYFSDRLVREVRQEENRSPTRNSPFASGSSTRLDGPRRRPAGGRPAFRRVRPAHFHDQHRPEAKDVVQGITDLTPQWTKV